MDHGSVSHSFWWNDTLRNLLVSYLNIYSCDTIRIDGTPRAPDEEHRSYSFAMKMRSSMTYGFGRLCERGRTHWSQSTDGVTWTGNPSMSVLVSRYMVALRKRKVYVVPKPCVNGFTWIISIKMARTPQWALELWQARISRQCGNSMNNISKTQPPCSLHQRSNGEERGQGTWYMPS